MLKSWREGAEMVRGIVFLLTVGVVLPLLFYDYLGGRAGTDAAGPAGVTTPTPCSGPPPAASAPAGVGPAEVGDDAAAGAHDRAGARSRTEVGGSAAEERLDAWMERYGAELAERFPGRAVVEDGEELVEVERQLREYFAGDRSRFELPVDLSVLTDFEQRVLEAARRIPYGEVLTYSEVARRIGRPKAARAVGNALGANPVAIVVPCHRVVRKDGSLGGYGGGEEYKEWLLELEGAA